MQPVIIDVNYKNHRSLDIKVIYPYESKRILCFQDSPRAAQAPVNVGFADAIGCLLDDSGLAGEPPSDGHAGCMTGDLTKGRPRASLGLMVC